MTAFSPRGSVISPRGSATGCWLLSALVALAVAACGDDISAPPPDPNERPRLTAGISHQIVSDSVTLDLSAYFADPDGDALTFSAASSDTAVARTEVAGDIAVIFAVVSGSARVTIAATDPSGLAAAQSFGVTVPNRAPQVANTIPDIEAVVGDEVPNSMSDYFTDPDRDSLTFTSESSDDGVATVKITGDEVVVSPVAPGVATITVTATDPDGLMATQDFSITVPNRAPQVADTLPDREVEVGDEAVTALTAFFSDPDRELLAFTAESSDAMVATASVSAGALTVTAIAKGAATISVTATDPGGLEATQDFAVTVPNRAPIGVDTIPDIEVEVGEEAAIEVSMYFTDPDGDELVFAVESSDSIRAAAEVSGGEVRLKGIAKGTATITVTATDTGDLSATQTFSVIVPNRAPRTADTIPGIEVEAGEEVAVVMSAYFTDPDGDSLAFTAESSDPGVAAISASGDELTVSGVGRGTATVTVTASDPEGLSAMQSFGVTVPNRAPRVVRILPDVRVEAGKEAVRDMSGHFMDPDGDELTYTASTSVASVATASVSGSELTVRGIAGGMTTVTVTATDPEGQAATSSFDVRVPNRRPRTRRSIPDENLTVGNEVALNASVFFTDLDSDALTFAASSSNADVVTAIASGDAVTVTAVSEGEATVTVTATDPGRLSATQRFAVTVTLIPPNHAPRPNGTIPGAYLEPGDQATNDVSGFFTDPDGDPLTFEASSSDDGIVTASTSGDHLTVRGITTGKATVTVTATDPGGQSATQRFTVTVTTTPPNRAPRPTGRIPDESLEIGDEVVTDVSGYFTDPDGDDLTFEASSSDASVATARASGNIVRVTAVSVGTATVTVTATDPGGRSATLSTGVGVRDEIIVGDGFDISLVFTDAVAAQYRPSIEAAASLVMSILAGSELEDVAINGTRTCREQQVDLGIVDDVVIVVHALEIDGDSSTLATAGACESRASSGKPILGSVRFDEADIDRLLQNGELTEIMVHEIIHVLGFGYHWVFLGLLVQDSDHYFTGPRAIAAFDAAGGSGYTDPKVPTQPGQGHWRESVFGQELMTPRMVKGSPDPLSAITLNALVDMGYAVNLSFADDYALPQAGFDAAGQAAGRIVDLGDDLDRGPLVLVDSAGRIVRVIRD